MDTNTLPGRVLCAVTFSPAARRVVTWATWLASATGSDVRLFHVSRSSVEPATATADVDSEGMLERLFTLTRHLPGRPRISAAVTDGDVVGEIVGHARLVKAELIAVGMHADDGSVSPLIARLARDAPCPVLVVSAESTGLTRGDALRRILVGVDFRPASLAGAAYAFALARAVRAQVTVVHVLPERWEGPPRRDSNIDETRRRVQAHFRPLLQSAARAASGTDHRFCNVVVSGRPCVELVRQATVHDADLLVMGLATRSSSAAEFGDTTSCVMRGACRTVVLVPARLRVMRAVSDANRLYDGSEHPTSR